MPKPNTQIRDNYDLYRSHLDSGKTIDGPLPVAGIKKNHGNFDIGEAAVTSDIKLGNTSAECKIDRNNEFHYTILYKSDGIDTRLLTRLDAGAGTHRNTAPDIPLGLKSVPTPHYHEYRKDGHDIAYPIEGVNYSDESSTKFDYNQGFSYFCDRLHITAPANARPSIIHGSPGVLPLLIDTTDPNADVEFPE